MSFWFGDFELDQERRQLLRPGQPVPLKPKAYELLSFLRIGPASGGEPHLFFTQVGSVQRAAFSADGRWLASSGERPSGSPLAGTGRHPDAPHRRSHEDLLATLRSWTNLRAVRDPQSPNGWKIEPGPFPGWAKLPQR